MSHSPAETLTGHFQASVDNAADALKAAASSTYEFSEEASAALSSATTELTKLADSLRDHAVDSAKGAARYAKHEVETHPMASLAAALTAVVAVIGMMAMNRRSKHPAA